MCCTKQENMILSPPCLVCLTVGEPEQSAHPLFKGDLAVRYGRGSPAHKSATRQGDLPTKNEAIRLFGHSLKLILMFLND
jgi:hypothetical protein